MATLNELLVQKAALDLQIEALQASQKAEALAKVRALLNEHGLTAADLAGGGPTKANPTAKTGKSTGKVAAKYRSLEGDTWSGRGLQPRWLKAALAKGKKIEEFAI